MKSARVVYASRRGRVTSVYVPRATLVSGSPIAFIPSIKSWRVAVMAYSNSPPGRRSSLWTVVVNPSGPHQDSRPSFVVQSSQTSFADAWKVRSNRIFGLETLADVAVFPFVGTALTSVERRLA